LHSIKESGRLSQVADPAAPLEGEEWRPIPGYEGYEASSLGRIRSLDRHLEFAGPWDRASGFIVAGFCCFCGEGQVFRGRFSPIVP
jgi:hypothetical protein